MITGSNTNVKHRGRLFHVQTEDSGRRNPHIISHVYFGGTILASEKTKYSHLLDLESDTLDKDIRSLIEEQHGAMVQRLKSGSFDAVIGERLDGKKPSNAPPPPRPVSEPATESEPPAPPPTLPGLDPPAAQPAATAAATLPALEPPALESAAPLAPTIPALEPPALESAAPLAPTIPALEPPAAEPAAPPAPPRASEKVARAFGEGVVSKKPLDEEILDYLVEKARDRARDRQQKVAGRSPKRE